MLNIEKETSKIEFENYLDIFLSINSVNGTIMYLIGSTEVMRNVVNDILRELSLSKRDLAKKINMNPITFCSWISGFYPYNVDKIYEILDIWKKCCNKDYKDYYSKLDDIFLQVRFFAPLKGCKIKLPKYLTPRLLYFIGYLYGDGCIGKKENGKFAVRFEDEFKEQIISVVKITESLFGRKCKIEKNKNAKSFSFRIHSAPLHQFMHKIFEMPMGKKEDKLKTPKIIKSLPRELRKWFYIGLFDADGHVTNVEKFKKKIVDLKISFFQKSKQLIEEFWDELKIHGIYFGNKLSKTPKGWQISTTKKEEFYKFYKLFTPPNPIKRKRLELCLRLLDKGWYSSIQRYNLDKARKLLEDIDFKGL